MTPTGEAGPMINCLYQQLYADHDEPLNQVLIGSATGFFGVKLAAKAEAA
jgi:hypothetical protein